jgi:mono/diheme cytochrome c family protein
MKAARFMTLAMALLLITGNINVMAADKKIDIGKREYEAHCITCHGPDGKGGGPLAEVLKIQIPDLTVMSRKNGGVFPFLRVYEAIDGRQQMQAHGTRDMLVWGNAYKATALPDYDDYPYDVEAFVRGRILALIDYLNRLQAK